MNTDAINAPATVLACALILEEECILALWWTQTSNSPEPLFLPVPDGDHLFVSFRDSRIEIWSCPIAPTIRQCPYVIGDARSVRRLR